jgi:hypothetical protein
MLKIRIEICDLQVVAICEIISNKQTRKIEKRGKNKRNFRNIKTIKITTLLILLKKS